jgi:hypothetical protein
MTLPETDAEFESYLKRRTVLPNGMSDHDKLEPPKALDASVLQEAREAIHAQQRLNRAPRWARPVALAATILLCLSILLNISLNTKRPTAASGLSSREAILPEAKVVEPRATRPPVLAEANTPAPEDSRRAHGTAVDKAKAFANGSRAYSPAPTAPSINSAAEKAAKLAADAGMPVQEAGETPSSANSAATRQTQLADRGRPPVPEPSDAPSADSTEELRRSAPGTGMASAPAAVARAQAPRAQPPASPSAAAEAAPQPPATASAAAPVTPPGVRADEAQGQDQRPDQPSALAKRKGATGAAQPIDPKTWLQQIAALRAAGKTAQADAEMQRFRAAFPAYPAKPDPSAASEPPK